MTESEPSGYAQRFDYRVDVLPRRNRIRVSLEGVELADSTRTLLVDEQDHGLVFYIPIDDVRMEALRRIDHVTRCPWKGYATHYALSGGNDTPIAWTYEDPYPELARIAGHVAFYQDRVTLSVGQAPYIGPR
ncbi:MAG: hypothetical protein QOI61_2097 [Actinomycetota bacterium]|jgi:uncharacterized protein (DUF427 family)